jgi:hypothetical protein
VTGSTLTVEIQLDDGRTIVATPRPEDQDLLQAWQDRGVALTDRSDDSDTSGHRIAATPDITLDVEGHAMTLRLPNSADVETLKKALAVGAVSATIVAAGAIAAMQNPASNTVEPVAPAAPISAPAPNPDQAQFREERLAERDPMWNVTVPGAASQTSGASTGQTGGDQDTHGPGRGELE